MRALISFIACLFISGSMISQQSVYAYRLSGKWYKDYQGSSTYFVIDQVGQQDWENSDFTLTKSTGEVSQWYWVYDRNVNGYQATFQDKANQWKHIDFINQYKFQSSGYSGYFYKDGQAPADPNQSAGSSSDAAAENTPPPPPPDPQAGIPVIDRLNTNTKTAQIHDAARSMDYVKIDELIKAGANPDVLDGDKGRSAMHYAAISGDTDIIDVLVKSDANINVVDKQGKTPLDLALEKGNYDAAKELLRNSANAQLASKGLDRILATKETELLTLFLQNGADANVAMNKAVELDNVEMLNVILDNSSARATNQMFEKAVNLRSQQTAIEFLVRGIDKDQAMDFVISKKDKQMVEMVLSTNATVSSTNKALAFAVEQRDMGLAQTTIDQYNANPTVGMAPAVKNNHLEMVRFLLSKGANPNDQMDEASAQGKKAIVEALLSQSANPDLGIPPAAQNNQTSTLQVLLDASGDANLAMPIAIEKGDVMMVNMCIAAPQAADVYRTEYIVTTCEKSNLDILNALLLAGADPNPGMPISVGKKDAELVRELITAGADVNKPEYLIKTAEQSDAAVALLLLGNGADPNPGMETSIKLQDAAMVDLMLQHNADATPPHLIAKASELGNVPIVTLLLDRYADPNAGMNSAIDANKQDVVSLLIEHGADGSKDVYLTTSAKHNNPVLTKMLLSAGGDPQVALEPAIDVNAYKVVELVHEQGVSITDVKYLETCVYKNYVATARVLADAGASAATWWDDAKGMNLLHISIDQHLNAQMAEILIQAGANVDKPTQSGDSPLHIAVRDSRKSADQAGAVVEVLISHNADVNAVDAMGETVLKVAPKKRPITKPLKDAGAQKKLK